MVLSTPDRPDIFCDPTATCGYCFPGTAILVEMGAFDRWHVTVTSTASTIGGQRHRQICFANSPDLGNKWTVRIGFIYHEQSIATEGCCSRVRRSVLQALGHCPQLQNDELLLPR